MYKEYKMEIFQYFSGNNFLSVGNHYFNGLQKANCGVKNSHGCYGL